MQHKYYVYVYYDPRKGLVPIYVGKGTKKVSDKTYYRAYSHLKRGGFSLPMKHVLKKIAENGLQPKIKIYRTFDREKDAYSCEKFLIKKIGCRWNKTGTLFNLKEGGEGGSYKFTKQQHKRVVKHLHRLNQLPSMRTASSVRIKKQQQDPEFVAKQSKAVSQSSTRNWANPSWREQQLVKLKEAAVRPEVLANRIKAAKKCWANRSIEEKRKQQVKMLAAKYNPKLTICGSKFRTIADAAKCLDVDAEIAIKQRKLEKAYFKQLQKRGIDVVELNKLVGETLVAAGFMNQPRELAL